MLQPTTEGLRRAGYYLLREGPTTQIWAKFRRSGCVVFFTAILRGTPGGPGNRPSTVWKLSVAKRVNARQRRELLAMVRDGLEGAAAW